MHCSNVDGAGSNRSRFGVCVGGVSDELLLIDSGALAASRLYISIAAMTVG